MKTCTLRFFRRHLLGSWFGFFEDFLDGGLFLYSWCVWRVGVGFFQVVKCFFKKIKRSFCILVYDIILRAYRFFELSPHGRHSGFSKVNPNPWAWWYPLCHPETAVDQVDGPEGFCDSDVMTHEQLFNKPPNTLVCRGTVWKGSITLAVILRENVPHLNYQTHQQWG